LSIDSLEIHIITLYPFSSATFRYRKLWQKKELRILGIITPIVLFSVFKI
jgi:hypothetical protein